MFEKAKARLKLFKEFGLTKSEYIDIPEIPKKWDKFMGSESKWVNIDLPEDEEKSSCLFIGHKNIIMPPHKYKFNEIMVVMNEGGEIEIITEEEIKIIRFGESYFVPKNINHAVKFKKETKILIIWFGSYGKGWGGTFAS